MLKLNLREIAKELDEAIECFDKTLDILDGYSLEAEEVSEEDRERIRKLSRRCIQLEFLRDETDTMVIERAIHNCNVQEAVKQISKVRDEFKDARSLINI